MRRASRRRSVRHDAGCHHPVRGLYRPDAAGRADRRVAGPGWPGRDRPVESRYADVRPAGGAAELLRGPGQVSASGNPDVRAGGLDLRPLRRGAAAGHLCHRGGRARPGHAAAGGDPGGDVPRRHFGLGPGQRGRGRRRDDRGDVARGLSRLIQRGGGRRGRGHRHPDPAVGGVHHLQRAGAGRIGAGAVRGRHDPGRARGHRADRAGGVAGAQAQHGRRRGRAAASAVLEEPARSRVGPGGAVPDPGRHARRLVHADRGRRGGGGLWPVRRHGGVPQHRPARPVHHLPGGGRNLCRDPAGGGAGGHLCLCPVDAGRDRSAGAGDRHLRTGRVRRARADRAAADDGGHVPRRHLDLPDLRAAAAADRQCLPLEPGVVRRGADAEGGAGPVHAAAGREPDGVVPDRARAHGRNRAVGDLDAAGDVYRHADGAGLSAAGDLAAGLPRLLTAVDAVFAFTNKNLTLFP
ncbi:hypothetical protein CBM2592_A90585 [Cupriavidus taiwanensis]|nr:hypothetical protein CBM2588_A60490 [Cupriavidus taiwanensis]SOY57378.1 hypothetical protein CBM2592_A90585 [Cupriavidus taiwanensis]SOY79384.1 hypothetical protein CBM2591_A100276 [Cupriavidus taiwanensis]SOZ26257.1 hypothetical protein CBM2608_A70174 [Cupriavidus taiwanensis]SOZ65292.1 hypothetical protein CBM2617_A90178 [Cupriavidus taiwanensis]